MNSGSEGVLLQALIEFMVILAAARFVGAIFRRLGQPQVCGEIAAGLILGPSLLGGLSPTIFKFIFPSAVVPFFSTVSQIGLVLLMFLIGFEFDFTHLRGKGYTVAAISLSGITIPFMLGLLIGRVMYPYVALGINPVGFSLFIATALSITAMPVLGRIMLELNIHKTPIGSLAMASAALDDVSGWTILVVVSAIVRSSFSASHVVLMMVEIALYAAFTLWVVRPILKKWARRVVQREGQNVSATTLTIVIVLAFASATITSLIGIFAVFGAFLIGATLSDELEFKEAVLLRLREFTTVFFLPVFFAYTGLRTDAGSLTGTLMWSFSLLVLIAAILGKLGGCSLAARFMGLPWRDALAVGTLMNTRGLMELIVINLGYDLGVIPRSVFFMLVLMAVATTYMTTPLIRRAARKTALEPLLSRSQYKASRS